MISPTACNVAPLLIYAASHGRVADVETRKADAAVLHKPELVSDLNGRRSLRIAFRRPARRAARFRDRLKREAVPADASSQRHDGFGVDPDLVVEGRVC
jgi:hypothetical protein